MRNEDLKNRTLRERHLSRMLSLIFHLNNNGIRYGMSYKGYEFVFERYNFATKEWYEIERHNFTKISYDKSYKVIHNINKRLIKELSSIQGEDWEDDYED